MITSSWLVTSCLLSASGLEGPVGHAADQAQPAFAACFELYEAGDVHAVIRFRVGADGRATGIGFVEDGAPLDPRLGHCLEAALTTVVFPEAATGADVAYPIRHFRTQSTDSRRGPADPEAGTPRWALGRSGNLVGDTWVVTRGGTAVSDLDLVKAVDGSALTPPLLSERQDFAMLAAAEGGLSLAGLGLAAYGGRDLARGHSPRSLGSRDIGMAAAGLLTAGVAGVLCLYHLLRTTDLTANRPVWHYLSREQAAALVAVENDRR